MSSKIYAIWGGNSSGKTTFAVNLACALSKRDVLVGLISSNLTYGELQTFFGQAVSPEKGLYEALREDNPNIGEKFTEYGESKNLFFLSIPTHYSGLLCDTVTLESVERMMNAASLVFDILLVDGATEINNPVSGVGLWLADGIFTCTGQLSERRCGIRALRVLCGSCILHRSKPISCWLQTGNLTTRPIKAW
jgi:MinD-like ATPase involved in chromosome partitioning or flagellar assembly